MGELTHAFVERTWARRRGACYWVNPDTKTYCLRPRSAHPASPPEPHSVAVALESRSLERDTPVAERGRGLNHPKGQGYAVAGREVRREPDTRSASSREGGSIPPSDTISPPEPAPESEEPPIVGNAYGTYSWRPDPAPEPAHPASPPEPKPESEEPPKPWVPAHQFRWGAPVRPHDFAHDGRGDPRSGLCVEYVQAGPMTAICKRPFDAHRCVDHGCGEPFSRHPSPAPARPDPAPPKPESEDYAADSLGGIMRKAGVPFEVARPDPAPEPPLDHHRIMTDRALGILKDFGLYDGTGHIVDAVLVTAYRLNAALGRGPEATGITDAVRVLSAAATATPEPAPEPEKLRRMAEEWYVSYDIEATDLVDSVARLLGRVVRECAAKSRWPSDEYGILREFGLSPSPESPKEGK